MDLYLFILLLLIASPGYGRILEDENAGINIWRYGGPYGHYCGIFHTSKVFAIPIDNVDRACQLHDTCISAHGRYLSCPCNEQLGRRMSEVCPVNETAGVYRDEIIRAMNVGVSLCGSSICSLMNRYDVSAEIGFDAIPFYGPISITISGADDMLIGVIPTIRVEDFGLMNLAGRPPIDDFKKGANGRWSVGDDETIMVYNPTKKSSIFTAV